MTNLTLPMEGDHQSHGFPPGYFVIRSLATGRLLDVQDDGVDDGTPVILWPEKEKSLLETLREPDANNQVFFIDTAGALCCRSSGHAIDIEGDKLVLRHRRPVSYPFPNAYSHHLPNFSYNRETLEISVVFASDPSFPAGGKPSDAWRAKSYILASVPMLRARTIIDDASSFVSTALTTSLSFLSGSKSPKSSPEDVFDGEIDLSDGQVLEQDRGEEGEVDDSTAPARDVRVLTLASREKTLGEQAMLRRQWKVESLRSIAAAHRAHGRRSSS